MRCALLFLSLSGLACGDGETLIANRSPQAFAGFDQILVQGGSLLLDGSHSFDPDDNGLTYRWSLISAPTGVTLSGDDEAQAELSATAQAQGTAIVALEVSDGPTWSSPDWLQVRIIAQSERDRPVANAGFNRHMRSGEPVILDGDASQGSVDTYRWVHLRSPDGDHRVIPDGVTALVSDLEVGLHVFGLSVAQSGRWSVIDCVSIMVSQDGGQTAFPEVTVEQQSDGLITLAAASDTQVSWALVSDPAGASTQLDGIGDNGTRLEYRSNANGTHLFSATLANGLSDWVAVELENTP